MSTGLSRGKTPFHAAGPFAIFSQSRPLIGMQAKYGPLKHCKPLQGISVLHNLPDARSLVGTKQGAFMTSANVTDGLGPWQLLRYGDAERGLALLREAYMRQRSSSHIMELGVAYLWTGDYASASAHFRSAIEEFPRHASSFYGMSGVSHWCLGESNAAVADWLTGLKAQYSETAGLGIRLPLLLFSASIL
jgi:tetratricopeptide (TPR) repeat protein